MGGACLTRMYAGIGGNAHRPGHHRRDHAYQLLYPVRKLLLWRDIVAFKMAANSRKILEAAFPPERFTPGHDPKKEYDAMEAYLKTFFDRTIHNVFWFCQTTMYMRRSAPLKSVRKSPTGTATTKRRIAGGISGSSSAIFPGRASMASPRWPMRNWAGDGTPGKILPVCGKISDYASGGKMMRKRSLSGAGDHAANRLCKAKEERRQGTIHDAKAEELIEKLDYDFSPLRTRGYGHAKQRHCPHHCAG